MFKNFLKNSSGSTAIILALSLTGILVAVGAAVDFGNQVYMREQMQTAMDQATLAGLSTANEVLQSGGKISTAAEKGEAAARLFLTSNGAKIENMTSNFDFVDGAGGLTVTSQAKVESKNHFMQLVGIKSTDLVTNSMATTGAGSVYREIYVFADTSTSMLLPTTQNGIDRMQQGVGCALACHDGARNQDDSYTFAKRNNIELRYDVVSQGIGQLMDYLTSDTSAGHTRAGLWTFNSTFSNPVPMTSNFSKIKTGYPAPLQEPGYVTNLTKFTPSMNNLISIIGRGGDGSSANSPKKLLILTTDGINDNSPYAGQDYDSIGPINMNFCQTLQSKNVTVAIVYTPYLPMPWSAFYNITVGEPGRFSATRATDVPIIFKKCAGDLMVVANDAASLRSAFQTVYSRTIEISPPRLTQ